MEQIESLNIKDLDQLESLMVMLSTLQKECNDTVKTIFDDSLMIQRMFVLTGGFGWKIEIQKVYLH